VPIVPVPAGGEAIGVSARTVQRSCSLWQSLAYHLGRSDGRSPRAQPGCATKRAVRSPTCEFQTFAALWNHVCRVSH
jgi:hypothetical protein